MLKRAGSCAFSNCCRRYWGIAQVCLTTRLGSAFQRGVDDRHSATWSLTKNRSNKKNGRQKRRAKTQRTNQKRTLKNTRDDRIPLFHQNFCIFCSTLKLSQSHSNPNDTPVLQSISHNKVSDGLRPNESYALPSS